LPLRNPNKRKPEQICKNLEGKMMAEDGNIGNDGFQAYSAAGYVITICGFCGVLPVA
jgi:hypothetical protein